MKSGTQNPGHKNKNYVHLLLFVKLIAVTQRLNHQERGHLVGECQMGTVKVFEQK